MAVSYWAFLEDICEAPLIVRVKFLHADISSILTTSLNLAKMTVCSSTLPRSGWPCTTLSILFSSFITIRIIFAEFAMISSSCRVDSSTVRFSTPSWLAISYSAPSGILTQLVRHLIAYLTWSGGFEASLSFVSLLDSVDRSSNWTRFLMMVVVLRAIRRFTSLISNGSATETSIVTLESVSSSLLSFEEWSSKLATVWIASDWCYRAAYCYRDCWFGPISCSRKVCRLLATAPGERYSAWRASQSIRLSLSNRDFSGCFSSKIISMACSSINRYVNCHK